MQVKIASRIQAVISLISKITLKQAVVTDSDVVSKSVGYLQVMAMLALFNTKRVQ